MATKIITKNGTGTPTTGQVDTGELAVNTTDGRLYTKNTAGDGVLEIGTNPSFLTSTGHITADGSSLIAQDTADSYATMRLTTPSKTYTTGVGGASVTDADLQDAYYVVDGTDVRFKIDSAGDASFTGDLDVAGAVTADGLILDQTTNSIVTGTADASDNARTFLCGGGTASVNRGGAVSVYGNEYSSSGGNVVLAAGDAISGGAVSGSINLLTGASLTRLSVTKDGDISFYEDTGTTAKFFWDASAESLGIGTSSPSSALTVEDGDFARLDLNLANSTGTTIADIRGLVEGTEKWRLGKTASSSDDFAIHLGGTEAMRIDSSGNVGIGTTEPDTKLHVYNPDTTIGAILTLEGAGPTVAGGRVGEIRFVGGRATGGSDLGSIELINDNAEYWDGVVNREDTALVFSTAANRVTSEKMRIDSSGNVGIGTSSPSTQLTVKGGTGDIYQVALVDGSDNIGLKLGQYGTVGEISGTAGLDFEINEVRRMRIDSSGNVLVGTTSINPHTGTSEGVQISGDRIHVSRSGGPATELNRYTNDGDITVFRKDGTTVGSIGTKTGTHNYLTIGGSTGTPTGLICDTASASIGPWNVSTNSGADAAIDLGISTRRFKDLYLSGGVYLGGTGAANHLDDYEEGTFTPSLSMSDVDFDSVTYDSIREGSYIKVGNIVTCFIRMRTDAITVGSASGFLQISGLPFTSINNTNYETAVKIGEYGSWTTNPSALQVQSNSTVARFTALGTTGYLDETAVDTGANKNYTSVVLTYRT